MSRLPILLALMAALIVDGSAEAQTPDILRAMPTNAAQLDAYLGQQQYLELRQALSKVSNLDELFLNMNWERAKMESGATAFIGFIYAGDLWRVAANSPSDKAVPFKETALKILLYTYAQISLDGTKCDDVSAPGHRIDQLFSTFSATWKSVATVPPERRPSLVNVALRIEQDTASKRSEDAFVCRNGLAEIGDALKKNGNRPLQEAPSQPGQVGRNIIVPPSPDFKPKFVGKEIWLPKQAALRISMRDALTQIVDKFAASK